MASRMAMLSAAAGAAATGARETTPALSEAGSETSSKRSHVGTLQHGLSLDLDDVFKLMDYLEKEGLPVISADTEAKAIARTKQKDNRPPQKFDDEAGILSRVRSNDAAQCLPNLDLSKSRLISAFKLLRFNKSFSPNQLRFFLIKLFADWLMTRGCTRRCA